VSSRSTKIVLELIN